MNKLPTGSCQIWRVVLPVFLFGVFGVLGVASAPGQSRQNDTSVGMDGEWKNQLQALALARELTATLEPEKQRAAFVDLEKRHADLVNAHPEAPEVLSAHAEVLFLLGRFDEAKKCWESALLIQPKNAEFHRRFADLLLLEGDVVLATLHMGQAAEIAPENPALRKDYAMLLQLFRHQIGESTGKSSETILLEAKSEYEKAMKLAPEDHGISKIHAEIFYSLEKPDWNEAVEAWQRTLLLSADPNYDRMHLVRALVSAGKWDAARQVLSDITDPALDKMKVKLGNRIEEAERNKGTP